MPFWIRAFYSDGFGPVVSRRCSKAGPVKISESDVIIFALRYAPGVVLAKRRNARVGTVKLTRPWLNSLQQGRALARLHALRWEQQWASSGT